MVTMSVSPIPGCLLIGITYTGFIGIVSYYFLKFRYEKKWTRKRKALIALLLVIIVIPPTLVAGVIYESYTNAVDIKRNYRTEQERNAIDIAEHYNYRSVLKSKDWGLVPNPTQIDTKAIEDAKSEVLGDRSLGLFYPHMSYQADIQSVDRFRCNFTDKYIAIINGNHTSLLVNKIDSYSRTLYAFMDNGSMKGFTYSIGIHYPDEIDINGSYLVNMTLNAPYDGGGRALMQSVFIDPDGKVQFFIIWPARFVIA